jgi:hypothetical protein
MIKNNYLRPIIVSKRHLRREGLWMTKINRLTAIVTVISIEEET